mmetsp:Transcript_44513/g.100502  ORF Transcript_44513/g.100502 Transcript_44513/m.100502 type:complete len:254 (-) Transcript_44513:863-1624(-)
MSTPGPPWKGVRLISRGEGDRAMHGCPARCLLPSTSRKSQPVVVLMTLRLRKDEGGGGATSTRIGVSDAHRRLKQARVEGHEFPLAALLSRVVQRLRLVRAGGQVGLELADDLERRLLHILWPRRDVEEVRPVGHEGGLADAGERDDDQRLRVRLHVDVAPAIDNLSWQAVWRGEVLHNCADKLVAPGDPPDQVGEQRDQRVEAERRQAPPLVDLALKVGPERDELRIGRNLRVAARVEEADEAADVGADAIP